MLQLVRIVEAVVFEFGPVGAYGVAVPSIRRSSAVRHASWPQAAAPDWTVVDGAPGDQSTVPATYSPSFVMIVPYGAGAPPEPPGPPR